MSSSPQTRARSDADARPAQATEPSDYGALNAAYLALFGAVVAVRTRRGAPEEVLIPREDLVPLGIATFALSKVVAKEKMGTWVREPFVEEDSDRRPQKPRGGGLRYAVGELLTCTRCIGAWAALGLVGLRVTSPPAGRLVTTVLATAGINDFLQAAFQYATGRANEAGS